MKPVVKKKLDIFNLFYSGAAVVILIGVIAKLLEWPAQDLLITGGLAIEAVVFGVSAIKYIDVEVKQEVATEATLSTRECFRNNSWNNFYFEWSCFRNSRRNYHGC